jgi:hypothetical protein
MTCEEAEWWDEWSWMWGGICGYIEDDLEDYAMELPEDLCSLPGHEDPDVCFALGCGLQLE